MRALGAGGGAPGIPIRELDASVNPIANQGASYVAAVLDQKAVRTQFLTRLVLSSCGIADSGGVAIVRSPALVSHDAHIVYTCLCRQGGVHAGSLL